MTDVECQRCKQPSCRPAQVPGSKAPCITCGQPYGNHCIDRHCETQFCFDPEKRAALVKENRTGTTAGFWEKGAGAASVSDFHKVLGLVVAAHTKPTEGPMTEDAPTAPDHERPTDPAPPGRATARVQLPDDGLVNGAGQIVNIKHEGYPGAAGILWCNAGSFRASHYHKEDSHLLYVLEGEVRYLERAVGATEVEIDETFGPGEAFDSPSMREHILLFTAPTILVSFAERPRTHDAHESDVVRVPRGSWPL